MQTDTIFFSYSRDDSDFVLNLAKNLRKAGAEIWLDQLDIAAGSRWDSSIEKALKSSKTLLVILSCSSVASNNVLDEVSFALEEHKRVVPVLLEECEIPFRLRRLQYANFTEDHKTGIATLIKALNLDDKVALKLADVAIDDPSEAKKVKQETIKAASTTQAAQRAQPAPPKAATQAVPQQQQAKPVYHPPPRRKSSNSTAYVIGGIVIGGIVVFVIIILFALWLDGSSDYDSYETDSTTYPYSDNTMLDANTQSQHDIDWNTTVQVNTLEGYMNFLYTYGKTTTHYNEVYSKIYSFLPSRAYAMYGINNVERYYNKLLYYQGSTLNSLPMKDDIITPTYETQLSNDSYYNWNGVFLQPGHRLVVLDVYVDGSDVVWAHVGY